MENRDFASEKDGLLAESEPELLALGQSLRNIRKQKGLTLRDIESDSHGRWKAVVIGSYERGDRALTLKKAVALARYYDVPLDQLLGLPQAPSGQSGPLSINLVALRRSSSRLPAALTRFAQEICRRRSDWNGEMLSLRASDRAFLAIIIDISEESLDRWLNENELLLSAPTV
jgi:transcriptional regulator with XRE-family HTH domain